MSDVKFNFYAYNRKNEKYKNIYDWQNKSGIGKIYSRKRFRIIKFNNRYCSKKLKNLKSILIIILVAIMTYKVIWTSINPVFDTVCSDKAMEMATEIINVETTEVMSNYNYDDFFEIQKDKNQNVKMINANVLKINQISSDVSESIQEAIKEKEKVSISIPFGSITGIKFLTGFGPRIPLKIATDGNIETELKSEFESQGINQTIHKVYLEIVVNISVLTSISTIEKSVKSQVLIAENVIVGDIPETYILNSEDGDEK